MSETTAVDAEYDVLVVGGGPAGLTAALYATRLSHDTALVDRGGGRAAMMRDTHNVIGVTEETSGNEVLATAKRQIESYGGDVRRGFVSDVERVLGDADDEEPLFRVETSDETFLAERVVLATGFSDERPDPPLPPTGRGLHYCLHCDAYMFVDEPVYVMGTGDSAAYVAMIMLNFTDDVDVLTRGEEPEWSEETAELLAAHPVDVVEAEIAGMNKTDDGWLESFEFEGSEGRSPSGSRTQSGGGTVRKYTGGFPMYGSDYNTELHESLGCDLTDDGLVDVDDHGRTSVDGVFAVGDVTPGHNQVPVAMGQGAKAGIAIHMDLRTFPRSAAEIAEFGPVDPSDVPAVSPEFVDTAVSHEGHAGGPRTETREVGDVPATDD